MSSSLARCCGSWVPWCTSPTDTSREQRMKHIYRCNFSLKYFPVASTTKTFLLLVSTFVYFYTPSCFLQAGLTLVNDQGLHLVNMDAIISGCFPTVSPFLLMSKESNKNPFCPAVQGIKNSIYFNNIIYNKIYNILYGVIIIDSNMAVFIKG